MLPASARWRCTKRPGSATPRGRQSARTWAQSSPASLSPLCLIRRLTSAAVEAVNAASLRFPASWVVKGRSVPLKAAGNGFDGGGVYYPKARSGKVKVGGDMVRKRAGEAWAVVSYDPGNAVHEYVHHLQHTLAGIDRLFQTLHRRRTTGPDGTRSPILPFTDYLGGEGREDQ
ncbi:MAG: hypothetical protein GDA47_00565 [Rhodospirillales bacterium]|nr:hypothetical protein [Rhodospirillales bacterium]